LSLDTLAQVQHLIGAHLERFASEEGLRAAWHRAEAPLHSYTGGPTWRANASIPGLHRQGAGGEENPVGLAYRLTAQQLAAHRPYGEDEAQR
jgi:hypothetical protein